MVSVFLFLMLPSVQYLPRVAHVHGMPIEIMEEAQCKGLFVFVVLSY